MRIAPAEIVVRDRGRDKTETFGQEIGWRCSVFGLCSYISGTFYWPESCNVFRC